MATDNPAPRLLSIQLEDLDPGSGRDAWELPTNRTMWAIFQDQGWTIGLRFLSTDGYPVLAEVRVFPDDGDERLAARGEWSKLTADVPSDGLAAAFFHGVRLGNLEKIARAALADPDDPVWPGSRSTPTAAEPYAIYDPDPPDHWMEWDDTVRSSGIDPAETEQRRTRGRKPLADEILARTSCHYVEALRLGVPIHQYVETKMREGDERLPVGQWIYKARQRDFLTEPRKPGQPGGELTQKAIAILKRIGFLPDDDEHKKETE